MYHEGFNIRTPSAHAHALLIINYYIINYSKLIINIKYIYSNSIPKQLPDGCSCTASIYTSSWHGEAFRL